IQLSSQLTVAVRGNAPASTATEPTGLKVFGNSHSVQESSASSACSPDARASSASHADTELSTSPLGLRLTPQATPLTMRNVLLNLSKSCSASGGTAPRATPNASA